jgi:hypothetical protein
VTDREVLSAFLDECPVPVLDRRAVEVLVQRDELVDALENVTGG